MAFLSDALARVKPLPTIAVSSKARELKAAGKDVISLGAGQPHIEHAGNIKRAAIKVIRYAQSEYMNVDGIPQAKVNPSDVTSSGRTVWITSWLNGHGVAWRKVGHHQTQRDGDAQPWRRGCSSGALLVSYPEIVLLAAGRCVFAEAGIEMKFKLEPRDAGAVHHAEDKRVIFSHPWNPTGAAYTRAQRKALADAPMRHPYVRVLSDNMQEHLVDDGSSSCCPRRGSPAFTSAC